MSSKQHEIEQDLAKTYNQYKSFEGQRYTGMKVGGRHKWHYDKGDWKEVKVAPDRWEFNYAVPKRRAGHAPPGSGVPVGTEYHWYILAHQNVRKLDENTYATAMSGLKYKLAHKRAGSESWSASDRAQRRRLIQILREMIADLENEPEQAEPVVDKVVTTAKRRAPGRRKPLVEAGNVRNVHVAPAVKRYRLR
ncbi:MAG TPA: hypothetical protein VNM14_25010 [Planctomycetota bacterium]|nr:hypothetical protein [Planctomycetota bacterium]